MSTTSLTPGALLASIADHEGLIIASYAIAIGLGRELRTEFERGHLIRLRRGVYMPVEIWRGLNPDQQYVRRIQAYAAVSAEALTFTHDSAAAIWGLPRVGAWPTAIHVLVSPAGGGRSSHGVVRHQDQREGVVVSHDGLLVTNVATTAVDMARVLTFPEAVAMMDRAIAIPRYGTALATRDQLEAALEGLPTHGQAKGRTAALRAGEFASTQSESCGESVSRAYMFLLGFLIPELQVRFDDAEGFIAFVDFFWRTVKRVGEFDGFGKYVKEEFTRGKTPVQVLTAEKDRENRVRACGPLVIRWDWDLANDPARFGAFLTRNGIPRAALHT
ncbi:hypothetical protein [Cryobacterium roopkundense]|uniref:Transcriptional regulator, AbiEi antitoxin, Type IV TA system n=1 Tax=Cryobacterium roopkundense TaxID=1001240 RepID=A0A7W8ZSX8_9MICO|nr:hypothetical protein [Cryobacterium roopkundense]MBB5639604.1 hypothetical protein [Cryobacterium roopkundense]